MLAHSCSEVHSMIAEMYKQASVWGHTNERKEKTHMGILFTLKMKSWYRPQHGWTLRIFYLAKWACTKGHILLSTVVRACNPRTQEVTAGRWESDNTLDVIDPVPQTKQTSRIILIWGIHNSQRWRQKDQKLKVILNYRRSVWATTWELVSKIKKVATKFIKTVLVTVMHACSPSYWRGWSRGSAWSDEPTSLDCLSSAVRPWSSGDSLT